MFSNNEELINWLNGDKKFKLIFFSLKSIFLQKIIDWRFIFKEKSFS